MDLALSQGQLGSDSAISAALATEDPEPSLLLEQPHGRNEPLINLTMWKHLIVQASYQLLILFLVIYGGPKYLAAYELPNPCTTYSNVDGHVTPLPLQIQMDLQATDGLNVPEPT